MTQVNLIEIVNIYCCILVQHSRRMELCEVFVNFA